jgi:hypothetical protein
LHILVVAFMLLSTPMAFAETLKIEIEERKFGKSEILVEIALPSTASNKKKQRGCLMIRPNRKEECG